MVNGEFHDVIPSMFCKTSNKKEKKIPTVTFRIKQSSYTCNDRILLLIYFNSLLLYYYTIHNNKIRQTDAFSLMKKNK
ncbi:unnamed protein product [Rotaria socialis]